MIVTRSKISADVQETVSRYGLRLRGSWLYGEQHLVASQGRYFSLSDIDIVSKQAVSRSVSLDLKFRIEERTKTTLLSPPVISVRVEGTFGPNVPPGGGLSQSFTPAIEGCRHNTIFWSYIALLELKDSLLKADAGAPCDVESYFGNKFLLNVWRNILLDGGESPTSYLSILSSLDELPHNARRSLLSIKEGEPSSRYHASLVSEFRNYTTEWVRTKCRPSLRNDLLGLLILGKDGKEFRSIIEDLGRVAESDSERGIIAYSKAKVGLDR